jgi:hypothetical protein
VSRKPGMKPARFKFWDIVSLVILTLGAAYFVFGAITGFDIHKFTNFGFGPEWHCNYRGSICIKRPPYPRP